jgi:HAMP domain-containing protein
MRLSTQIITGHAFMVICMAALSALGIAIVHRLALGGGQQVERHLKALAACRAMENAVFRQALAQANAQGVTGGTAVEFQKAFEEAVSVPLPAKETKEIHELRDRAQKFSTTGEGFQAAATLAADIVTSILALLRMGAEEAMRFGKSGFGLIAMAGAIGLLVTLYFGHWLARTITQPLESLARGMAELTSRDPLRRFPAARARGPIAEISAGVNELLDRLHRAESAPQRDLLLVCGGIEALLAADPRPGAVLSVSGAVLASNDAARRLVLEKGSSFQWVLDEAQRKDAERVEVVPIHGPGGEMLGQLARLRASS